MKKIAVINDLSGLGKCSLTAALPVISAMGVQACPLPTAILSNQTGYASYFCDDYTQRMDAYMEEWKKREFRPDGVYTGFLAGEAQADKILKFLEMFCTEETQVLVDPIMGDEGRAFGFYTEGLLKRMQELARLAWYLTPNLTEAMLLLYGKEGMRRRWAALEGLTLTELRSDVEMLGAALCQRYSIKALAITGIHYQTNDGVSMVGNLVWENGQGQWISSLKTGGSYSGTGDLFASVFCAGLVKGWSAEASVKKAAAFLEKSIAAAAAQNVDRNDGVCFEPYLSMLME